MKNKFFTFIIIAILAFSIFNIAFVNAKDSKEQKDTYTVAVISTEKGDMKAVIFTDDAPITTKNFIDLAKADFYKNMVFHRVVEDFVIQTGDPTGTGSGGSGKTIPLEINKKLKHKKRGMLAMARKADPDSATSQFYITIEKQPKLDYKYAVFGEVYEGLDVIPQIRQGDSLNSVKIIEVPKSEIKFKK
ncbi:MAG: peptidylprolyl isomerase [Vampirovibrionia bacterium]